MTDNEIKKDLLFVAHYCHNEYNEIRVNVLLLNALDLINRQQADKEALIAGQETLQKALAEKNAEIERLKFITTNNPYCVSIGTADIFTANHEEYEQLLANIKAEATKEFAERLKKHIESLEYNANTPRKTITVQMLYDQINWVLKEVIPKTIDGALKEMVGDAE